MGDQLSDVSAARDKFEFVNENPGTGRQPSKKELVDMQSNEEPVSAAVSLVVSSARHGVVSLCASVAHILREKNKLQQQVADLEKQLVALENSSSRTLSINGGSSVNCQSTNLYSLQESPISQRCGSAPASFIASGLKFLRTDYQNNVCSQEDDSGSHNRNVSRTFDCRNSSVSMPETRSGVALKVGNDGEKKASFIRGSIQSSTRSLNISRSLPASRFLRRKYSTVSLRRVRRSAANKQKASSNCSTSSINSYTSLANSEEQRRSSNNSSCIITIAEIHSPPSQVSSENSEGEAVRLLARTLTSVLQKDASDQENISNESSGIVEDVENSQASKSYDPQEFSLPHPLAGCECTVCLRIAADPNCQLYALTTDDGSLLPPGSRVLVEGERVGTVVYLGHEKYLSKDQRATNPGPAETTSLQEGWLRPVGVVIRLWAPDQGEVFVPLSEVICQLDNDLDLPLKESWSSLEYEYLDEDSDEENVSYNLDAPVEQTNSVTEGQNSLGTSVETKSDDVVITELQGAKGHSCNEWKPSLEGYFIRSPSVSSCSSVISHSLGDLSMYGLECTEDDPFDDDKGRSFQEHNDQMLPRRWRSSSHRSDTEHVLCNLNESQEDSYTTRDSVLNTTFSKVIGDDKLQRDYGGSLYDTCDSAISLSFNRRLQYSEDNSEPSSLTDTGRDTPSHFGDTWDSGCSVGRARCRSDSSGHFSDAEVENTRLTNTFTKSLGDALNYVLEKHNLRSDWQRDKYTIESEDSVLSDRTIRNTEVWRRYHQRKEPLHGYHHPLTDRTPSSSAKFIVSENMTGQSEV